MKRTGAGILLIAAIIGGVVGFVLDTMLTAMGRATFTPAASLPTILALVGAVIVVLAVPVFRATGGEVSDASTRSGLCASPCSRRRRRSWGLRPSDSAPVCSRSF